MRPASHKHFNTTGLVIEQVYCALYDCFLYIFNDVRENIPECRSEQRRTRRNILIAVGLVIGLPLICCIASSTLNRLAPSTPSATATAIQVATVDSPSPTRQPSTTIEPTVSLATLTILHSSDFTDANVMNIGWLESGSLLVTLKVPNGVEGNYLAIVDANEFTCEIMENYLDQFYCHGTGVKTGTQVDASWYLEGVELPVYEAEIAIP